MSGKPGLGDETEICGMYETAGDLLIRSASSNFFSTELFADVSDGADRQQEARSCEGQVFLAREMLRALMMARM